MENVSTDDPHADRTTNSADHQELSATEVVDEEQNPNDGEYGLDHAEDTGGQEGSAGSADTNRGEHSRGVVVDCVDARTVLPHEQHASKEQAPHDLAVFPSCLEGLPETLTDSGSLFLENEVERSDFFNDVHVVGGQVADPAKVLDGGLAAVLGHEPAGALLDPESSEEKHTSGDQLNGEGDNPLSVVGRKSLLNAVVDPETDQASELPAEFVDTDKATSNGGWCDLGDVDWRDHRASAGEEEFRHDADGAGLDITKEKQGTHTEMAARSDSL